MEEMSPSPTVRLVSVCVGKVGGWNLPCAAVEREVSRSLSANGAKRLRHLSPSYTRVRAPTHTHTHTYTKFPLLFSLSILQLLFISFVFSFLLPPLPCSDIYPFMFSLQHHLCGPSTSIYLKFFYLDAFSSHYPYR